MESPRTFDEFVERMRAASIDLEDFNHLVDGTAPDSMYEREEKQPGDYYAKFKKNEAGEYVMKPEWLAKQDVFKSIGEVKEVAQKGGEDQGSEYYYIYSIGDFLVKVEGHYTSYDGTEWGDNDFKEVRPTTKTVTVYE